jgi:SPP1 family predicted phage head-tail adaptor
MDYKINSGDLRTRITLQQPTIVTDAGGAQSETYANVPTNPTMWAKWVNAHGDEAVNANAETFVQRATVTMRYRADVQTTWRLTWTNETWRIISIDQVQHRNRWTEMVVERVKGTV